MSKIIAAILTMGILGAVGAGAQNDPCANMKKLDSSCQQICSACAQAGYAAGQWKKGNGFWVDCVQPIMQGKAEPAKAAQAGHTLPTIPAATVAQCHSKNPKFGEGK